MNKAVVVTDLSFGDAGKGTTVDYLARQTSSLVVRHNGGPQAAHNVMTDDGRHHTFAQFGSGSFVANTPTYLSRYMLLNPMNMFLEATHLREIGVTDVWQRMYVDADAVLITPWHQAANRIRELSRGDGRHGSCAQGIGETMACNLERPELTLRVRDINGCLIDRLQAVRLFLQEKMTRDCAGVGDSAEWDLLADEQVAHEIASNYRYWLTYVTVVDQGDAGLLMNEYDQVIFEGAQGVLLDEWRGFHPYTTWSTTTSENALTLLDEIGFGGDVVRLGIVRAYTTRHGPGPFVTEDSTLTRQLPELHNGEGIWQGGFRIGHLDLVAHRYAVQANGGIDQVVVTGLDRSESWRYCDEYIAPDDRFIRTTDGHSEIVLGQKGDLMYQDQLTNALLGSRPVYAQEVLSSQSVIHSIEQALEAPVAITSHGPTAASKCTYAIY